MSKEKIRNPIKRSHLISISSGATVGCLIYVAQIRAYQYMFKMCRIHSGLPIVSSVLGGVVLSTAFVQSTVTMVNVTNFVHRKVKKDSEKDMPLFHTSYETLICSAVVNLGIYKQGYKQNLRTVLPSHILLPGSFAVEYLALTSTHVTKHKKQIVQELGHKYGCHHCGGKAQRYIADHIPSTRYLSEFSNLARLKSWHRSFLQLLFKRDVLSTQIHPQVLFPQCRPCSHSQGGFVSQQRPFLKSLQGKGGIVMHKMRPHYYFMFMFPIYLVFDKINMTITFG